jgi:glycosyltransferase involved in cell wall biosynthesis
MVCSLKKYKGVFEFIDLADLMRKTENLHFQLVLNASENEIEDFLRNVTKSPNLLIFDRQENVSKFYQEADLLLNLSRPESWIETFGLTILEGMAYGLPAIVPPVGGPTEIVRNNENGFHISCYELDKIAKKIKFLMKNKDKYHTLSTNAKSRAKDSNLEIFQNEIKNALEDTVSSR